MNEIGRDFWDAAVSMSMAAQKQRSVASIVSPYEGSPLDLTVLLYCRDNQDDVLPTLETIVEAMEVVGKTYEILVIDDCSKDRTAEFIRGFMAEFPKCNMVLRINKVRKGVAQNYFDGAFIGCGKHYRMVYADNSEPVETMVDVLRTVGEADVIVPYYISMYKKSLFANLTSGEYSWLINLISGQKINCYTASHMHLRYNVMRWHSNILGPAFQIDLLCTLLDLGFTCKQVPCRAVPQRTVYGRFPGIRNFLSVMHALLDIVLRKISKQLNNN